ncbi:hypothetical protein ACOCEA_09195 [Maribacter sp. CXY002]|uniref:hypothetical protein n=1 Tax=Maribacter luteocoastalis TaxID=3407671 RepID=UPI003B6838AA
MNGILLKVFCTQRRFWPYLTLVISICTIIFGCRSAKNGNATVYQPLADQKLDSSKDHDYTTKAIDADDHLEINIKGTSLDLPYHDSIGTLTGIDVVKIKSDTAEREELRQDLDIFGYSETNREVANKIIENYLNSTKKQPGGHCLAVSRTRFEKAYEGVHGHSVYEDLPDSMATAFYTPSEVFHNLYVSAQGTHEGWRSLPLKYRGKGNAGAIAYAGMGTLVDWFGIWSGELLPGALMQVWKRSKDYELVVKGVNKKDFDPFGHSFIFLGYVHNDKNEIIGIRIADQGYQSYRPLLPSDYEVWWAVNLTI